MDSKDRVWKEMILLPLQYHLYLEASKNIFLDNLMFGSEQNLIDMLVVQKNIC